MKAYTLTTVQAVSLGAVMALCLLANAPAEAQEKGNRGQLSNKDYKFVTEAVKGGNEEVTMGQLAVTKAVNQNVKDFGQRMVTDHTKANQELAALLKQKNTTVTAEDKKDEKPMKKLEELTGANFDKAYMKDMLADHKKDVKEFEDFKADDADLKKWVATTLPVLQEHLKLAQTTEAALIGTKSEAENNR